MAFVLGPLEDLTLRVRPIADCRRVCAPRPPIWRPGRPLAGADSDLAGACLMHRYPGRGNSSGPPATPGQGRSGSRSPARLESDDGDVADRLGADRQGIVLKPASDRLPCSPRAPWSRSARRPCPLSIQPACLFPTSACRTRRAGCSSTPWSRRCARRWRSHGGSAEPGSEVEVARVRPS